MKTTLPLFGAALFLTLFLAACGSGSANKSSVLHLPGKNFCAVHRVPLITVVGYEDPEGIFCPGESDEKRMRRYPNSLGIGRTLSREADWLRRCNITYCPRCQEGMEGPSRSRPASMQEIQGVYTLYTKGKAGGYYAGYLITLGDGVFSSELFTDVGNSHSLNPKHGRFKLDGCLLELRYRDGTYFHQILTQRRGRYMLWSPKQYEEFLRTGRTSEFVLYQQPQQ